MKTAETVEERFRRLAANWHQDTDCLSSMDEADRHPAYQEIIRLGPEVVPLLLGDLAQNHTNWLHHPVWGYCMAKQAVQASVGNGHFKL